MKKICLILLFITSNSISLIAQSKSQSGVIMVDGTPVYKAPNFDAPVIDYLDKGKKFRISRKVFTSTSGLGSFYKIKLSKGKYGYVADTEIEAQFKAKKKTPPPLNNPFQSNEATNKDDENNFFNEPQEEVEPVKKPILFTNYIGVNGASVNLAEKFEGKEYSAFISSYGLKLSGPGILFDGPPVDIEVNLATQAPEYYTKFADKVTGQYLHGHLAFILPLKQMKYALIYYGLGAMFSYTKYTVVIADKSLDSQAFNGGAVVPAGFSLRLGSFILKAEFKYYWEKAKYIGFGGALQKSF